RAVTIINLRQVSKFMLLFSWERMSDMAEIIATAESVEQAEQLLAAGVDQLYIGNDDFGLRLPKSFSNEEIKTITKKAHEKKKKVVIEVNGLMHNEHIERIRPYLRFLEEIGVDALALGDPGIVQIMRKEAINIDEFFQCVHCALNHSLQL